MPDANVAAKWYLDDENDLEPARELAQRNEFGLLQLAAPDCFYYEFGNLIRTAERRQRISPARARDIIRLVGDVTMATTPTRLLLPMAFDRCREFEISLYDAFYLVTAEMLGATFVTADGPLHDRLGGLDQVRRLG